MLISKKYFLCIVMLFLCNFYHHGVLGLCIFLDFRLNFSAYATFVDWMAFKFFLSKRTINTMFMTVCLLVSVLHRCQCADLIYYVEEGKSPGTLVGDIAADSHLMDSVPPHERQLITFSQLTGGSQLFRVSKERGKLYTTQTLDAESLCIYNTECFLMVDVAVQRQESFMKVLEVKVVIQDVNDHQPEFPDKQVSVQFEENDALGTKISIPNAKDKDVSVFNSLITYQLEKNSNEPFALSVSKSVDGTSDLSITLKERLDREVEDSYLIQVIAKDGGSPPKQSVLDIHVSVIDVNDNPPIFSQKVYNVSVYSEHNTITPVAILSASDLDAGRNGKISYQFSSKTSTTARNFFQLNKESGEIFRRDKLRLEQEMAYKLYVKATDEGSPPLSSRAMVLVNVINQQNNAPTIDVNFVSAFIENTATISEDIKVGSFIAFVKVTDHDVGQNGEVSCDLHHDKFQLQNLGTKKYKVIVKNPVDRESSDHYDITISCADKGFPPLHCENKITIKVMDVNDVQPQFSKEIFKFQIHENQKSKIPVGYINATDPDLGAGGKLTYSLLTSIKQFLPFQIRDDGLVSTIMSLDHEFRDIYRFKVFVKDNGIPSLNNTVNVIVEIKDENDNAPYFTFPSVNPFTLDVVYYPHHTKNITQIKASDSDSRENAFLKYEITRGNDKQLFALNHYTGLLSFNRVLGQQDAGSYDLEFVVKDSGTPVLSARTSIFMTLSVSNKTSEMLNIVRIRSDDKINLNLAVIIVLVAVSVSVIITASMSVGILRCNDQRNAPHRDGTNSSDRYVREQRHLMCPSYPATSCSDITTIMTDQEKARNLSLSRRESSPGHDFGNQQKSSVCKLKPQNSIDIAHQVSKDLIYKWLFGSMLFSVCF